MGTTVDWGSSHINLELQGQGDTVDHLNNITLVQTACRRAPICLHTYGHQITVIQIAILRKGSQPYTVHWQRQACGPSHP